MRIFLDDTYRENLISESDKILSTKDAEYFKKVLAVRAALKGVPTKEIAECFQVTERTVQIWIKKVMQNGYFELTRKRGSGRPAKLRDSQLEEIRDWVLIDGPSLFIPDAQEWTGSMLSSAILNNFHVKISSKWCSDYIRELCRRWGYNREKIKNNYDEFYNYRFKLIPSLRDEIKQLKEKNKSLKKELAKSKK